MTINFFLLISLTLLVISKASAVIDLFYSNFFFINHISILEKVRKIIFKTIFILVLAKKEIFLKNQIFLNLF